MPKSSKNTQPLSKNGKKLNKNDRLDSISDEDKQLFADAMSGVKKMKPDRIEHPSHQVKRKPKPPLSKNPVTDSPKYVAFSDHSSHEPLDGNQIMSFGQHQIQLRQWQRLKAGKIPIDATLDLHGLTSQQARELISQCLFDALKQQKRCLCIIHGRAKTQAHRYPILKNHVYNWLQQHPEVLAFHSCPRQLGGAGAVLVLLKRKRH